jgi:hypothetical protein
MSGLVVENFGNMAGFLSATTVLGVQLVDRGADK